MTMKLLLAAAGVVLSLSTGGTATFTSAPRSKCVPSSLAVSSNSGIDRADFLTLAAVLAAATAVKVEPAWARGRATLELSYERYTPRIVAGGQYYGGDLRKLIEKNDWSGIKAALAEPPKRTRSDKAKTDGGFKALNEKTGDFSDSRVLAAMDLFAGSFSDNSISPKTKNMQEQVSKLREVVKGINDAASAALGEKDSGGGFFGLGDSGRKKQSPSELAKTVRGLYVEGGNTWNQYVYLANDELPIQLGRLPYL